MKIAIQGEPGSFSHDAATRMVAGATIVPCAISSEVFAALTGGAVDAAVIPIENSLAGSVSEHFDLLLANDVRVVRESLLRIRHNLIAIAGSSMDEIQRVFSHQVALAQCRRLFAEHPRMEPFSFYDTAGSVKHLVKLGDKHAAAIASEAAARHYGAAILKAGIEDNPENFTRFFLVRRADDVAKDVAAGRDPALRNNAAGGGFADNSEASRLGPGKMSVAFSVENRPGSLVAVLNELAARGTNLTKIESRPVHGSPWEYIFYVDFQIGSSEEGTRAIEALAARCGMVKELGRYAEARQTESA